MNARTVTLEIPDDVRDAIQETVDRTGRDFTSVAGEMLSEAVKMQRVPGIVFADGASGRRARVAGTGIEVFEVIRAYRSVNEDWANPRESYHWLSEGQLRAALAYARAFPGEIEQRLRDDEYWTPERIWEQYPFTRPRPR